MVRIVTDSVASIPVDLQKRYHIDVLTLHVNYNDVEYKDAEMDLDVFYQDIYHMADNPPVSSQPSQHELEQYFEARAQAGDEVLGVWISSRMSGTYEGSIRAARAVKERYPDFKYAMIDSASTGLDEGMPVLDGGQAIEKGSDLKQAIQAVLDGIVRTRFLFVPESLTFLQKGGRIGGAAALIGNLIKLVPILTVRNGEATSISKARTMKKALTKVLDIVQEDAKQHGGLARLAVQYIGSKAPALIWAREQVEPLVDDEVCVVPVSPVLGVHVGPAIGIVYECRNNLEGKYTQNLADLVCVG